MVQLPETWLQLVRALVRGTVAWQTPPDLAAALGWTIEATTDVLALLDENGWVQVWVQDQGPVVTLSPLGAERLGVRLAEFGAVQTPRWVSTSEPDPPPPRAKHVCTRVRAAALNFYPDPHLSPEQAVERVEELARYANYPAPHERAGYRFDQAPPWPTILLGLNLTPWPGPWRDSEEEACPACGHIELKPSMYCLYCDRWGLDGVFATVRRPRRAVDTNPREREALERQIARVCRRARRRARFASQNQEELPRKPCGGEPASNGTPLAGSESVG